MIYHLLGIRRDCAECFIAAKQLQLAGRVRVVKGPGSRCGASQIIADFLIDNRSGWPMHCRSR